MHQNYLANIRQNLIKLGGSLNFGLIELTDNNKIFLLLIQKITKPIFIAGIILQHKPCNKPDVKSVYFIESLDTTGYFQPQEFQSQVTKTFVTAVLEAIHPSFLEVFSHPKNEIIFGKSASNNLKGQLQPSNLHKYWIDIFDFLPGNLYLFSNYTFNKTIPYKKDKLACDIFLFEDDPKRKLFNNLTDEITAENFYSMLLQRPDFYKGAFIYKLNDEGLRKCFVKSVESIDIYLKFLQKADFSSRTLAEKSTEMFLDVFKLDIDYFTSKNYDLVKRNKKMEEEIPEVVLQPRKK